MANSDYSSLMAAGGGLLGSGLGQMFGGWENPADAGMDYLNKMPGMLNPYYSPYMKAGQGALPILQDQYGRLVSDPGGAMNKIGASYQQSPGFQFALQNALKGANQSAAAGGMAGSPQSQQQNMGIATNMANQDYNQWMQNALGMYGRGLQGEQGLYNTGFEASKSMADQIAQMLAAQSSLAYQGQNAENQHQGGMWGSLLGGAGMLLGGPFGGMAGSALGSLFGG